MPLRYCSKLWTAALWRTWRVWDSQTYVQEESRRENTKNDLCVYWSITRVIILWSRCHHLGPLTARENLSIRRLVTLNWTDGGSELPVTFPRQKCHNLEEAACRWLHALQSASIDFTDCCYFLSGITFDMTKVALQKADICHGCWGEKVASVHLARANRSSCSRGERPPHCEGCNKTYRQKVLANNNDQVFQIEHPVGKLMLTFIARSLTVPLHWLQARDPIGKSNRQCY